MEWYAAVIFICTHRSLFALQHFLAKVPKLSFSPCIDIVHKAGAIFSLVFNLNLLEMSWLPMETDEAADEKLSAIFGRFGQSLMK